jgi:hypothetical protein
MLGLMLTLLAGFLVICCAFCFSGPRRFKADALFYLSPNRFKRAAPPPDNENSERFDPDADR